MEKNNKRCLFELNKILNKCGDEHNDEAWKRLHKTKYFNQ